MAVRDGIHLNNNTNTARHTPPSPLVCLPSSFLLLLLTVSSWDSSRIVKYVCLWHSHILFALGRSSSSFWPFEFLTPWYIYNEQASRVSQSVSHDSSFSVSPRQGSPIFTDYALSQTESHKMRVWCGKICWMEERHTPGRLAGEDRVCGLCRQYKNIPFLFDFSPHKLLLNRVASLWASQDCIHGVCVPCHHTPAFLDNEGRMWCRECL